MLPECVNQAVAYWCDWWIENLSVDVSSDDRQTEGDNRKYQEECVKRRQACRDVLDLTLILKEINTHNFSIDKEGNICSIEGHL